LIIFALIDVVTAYKNLKKEKEALESTVQVLSSTSASVELTNTDNETNSNAKEVIVLSISNRLLIPQYRAMNPVVKWKAFMNHKYLTKSFVLFNKIWQ
jgi:hypothetical protein